MTKNQRVADKLKGIKKPDIPVKSRDHLLTKQIPGADEEYIIQFILTTTGKKLDALEKSKIKNVEKFTLVYNSA
jgi:hypothetical protein